MAWAKLDDRMPWSRKIQPLSDKAFRLYVTGIAWCAAELTDGFISDADVALLPLKRDRTAAARELVANKLWTRVDGGYQVHDFLEYNRSAARVKQDRKATAARQERHRAKSNGVTNASDERVTDAVTDDDYDESNGVTNASPSRPVPSSSSKEDEPSLRSVNPAAVRDDVEQACAYLADRIEQNGSKRPTVNKDWRTAARLMIDKDGVAFESLMGAITWSQDHDFWRSNILSMPTLRKQYDRMRLQAEAAAKPQQSTTDRKVQQTMDLAARLRAEGR